MLDPVKNWARCVVDGVYSSSATEVILQLGEGNKLPDPSVDGDFNVVWWNSTDYPNPSDDPKKEIPRVTGRTGDILTIVRPSSGNSYNGEGSDNIPSAKNTTGKVYLMALMPTKKASGDVLAAITALEEDVDIHGATAKTTLANADEFHLANSENTFALVKITWENLKAAIKTYLDTIYPPQNGWVSYSTVTPTRASADDPTYVLTFAGVDLTSTMSVGMKVKFTQNSATIYGIITAIAFSTNTTVTIYCGTDYDVLDTATYAISAFNYSTQKAPLGFPLDPTKWSVSFSSGASSQASPAALTWYNKGGSFSLPIGVWTVRYQQRGYCYKSSAGYQNILSTISTANNTESDSRFTIRVFQGGVAGDWGAFGSVVKTLVLSAKTTFYVNIMTGWAITNIQSEEVKVEAVCAYL